MTKRYKYLYPDTDRHGNQRLYFKPPGHKKTRIKEASGSKAMKAEYNRLFAAYEAADAPDRPKTVQKGSMEWMLRLYMASGAYRELAENTRKQRDNFYTRFNRAHGTVLVADLTASDLAAVRDALPRFAARNFIKSMRAAFKWAMLEENKHADSNPAAAVDMPSGATKGHKSWTIEDVMQFKEFHPKGSTPRKVLASILFTAREISGVRTLGRKDVRDGMIRGERQKTWTDATTPVLSILRDELGDDYNSLFWIAKTDGQPYSANSLPQRFSQWATDAGLDGLTAHGLRKAVGTILADLGFSENTIMAALSHESSTSAQVYVVRANKKKLAKEGMLAVEAEISHLWKVGEA